MVRLEFGENMRMAMKTLRENKLRSLLTVLAIVIAVAVIIVVGSIMVGLDRDMRGFLNQFGPETLFVFKFEPGIHIGRLSPEERNRKPLTLEDALAIQELSAVRSVTTELYPRFGTGQRAIPMARYKSKEISGIDFSGALSTYQQVYNIKIEKGRFFSEPEDLHRADVAVIGWEIADKFFPGEEPLDKFIQVDGVMFRVIGVMAKKEGTFFKDQSADKAVTVPYRTHLKHHPSYDENVIGVEPVPGMKAAAEDQIRDLLRRRRKVAYDKPDNFGISSAEQISQQFRQIMGMLALMIVVISSIGLLVGGVGVMNIMLMSVTERTREIGVRKAMGARRRDIIYQFLTEAISLTGMGGIVGVLFGSAIALLIKMVMPLPTAVPLWAVVTGVSAAMSIGVFFGMYPAVRASKLDPVEALRYE